MSKFLILASLFLAQAEADFSTAFLEPVAQLKEPELLSFACRLKATGRAGGVFYGSAIIIKGGIITCEHCVRDAVSLEVEYMGQSVPARIVKSDRAMDVALLQPATAGATSKWPQASLALQPVIAGESLRSCGRNAAGLLDVQRHRVTLAGTMWDVRREFEYTNAPTRGRSGGGVFNASGELVGLARAERMDLHHGIAVCVESIRQAVGEAATVAVPVAAGKPVREITVSTASWCGWCHAMQLDIEQLYKSGKGDPCYRVTFVDVTAKLPPVIDGQTGQLRESLLPLVTWTSETRGSLYHEGKLTLPELIAKVTKNDEPLPVKRRR